MWSSKHLGGTSYKRNKLALACYDDASLHKRPGYCSVDAVNVLLPDGFIYNIAVSLIGDLESEEIYASVTFIRIVTPRGVFETPARSIGCSGGFYQGEVSTDMGIYSANVVVRFDPNYQIPDSRSVEIDLTIDISPVNGASSSVNVDLTSPDEIGCFNLVKY